VAVFYEDFWRLRPKCAKDRGVYYTRSGGAGASRADRELLEAGSARNFPSSIRKVSRSIRRRHRHLRAGRAGSPLERVAANQGRDAAQAATVGARNLHAFEILVGPYAVAHCG